MSSQQPPQRLTSRQASAQAQRRAMTERRQRLTQRIRKQKKSDWLAQKRGVVASNSSCTAATTTSDLARTLTEFLHHVPPTSDSLQQLYTGLQLDVVASSTIMPSLEDPTRMELAQKVVQKLDETMEHCLMHNDLTMALMTVQILVQLVAMSSSPSYNNSNNTDQTDSYYGRKASTWCDLIVEQSNIGAKIPRVLSSIPAPPTQQQQLSTISDLTWQVVEQTCWFVGNLAQELPSCCSKFRREGNLVVLFTNLLTLVQSQTTECNDNIIRTVQAAAWAFHNLLKGDVTASGYDYCQCNNHAGMNPALANALLTLSVPVIQTSFQTQNSCIDISVQTAWILVHLSQREDDVVGFLLHNNFMDATTNNDDLVRNVLERLYQVCEGAQQQVQGAVSPSAGRPNYFHHPLLEPCLEVLGHWSTASNGKHVPRLLTATQDTTRVPQELSLLPILETLLQWGQQGLLQQSDYVQSLWLSGCLLCDAGMPSHPATKVAAPSLLPLLTRGLTDNPSGNGTFSGSRANSLECKREGVMALWNAVKAPPTDDEAEPVMLLATRKFLLRRILSAAYNSNMNVVVLCDALDKESTYTVLMALKNLLLCQDVDAMLASMHVLDAILRQIPASRVVFHEVHGDEALETVCDLPLGNDQASSDAANMAAELIDDFFDSDRVDDPNDQFADPVLQPAQAGGTFVFGMDQQAAAASAPIFMPDLLSPNENSFMGGTSSSNPTGHVPAIAPASVGEPMSSGMGRGRGRGRGHMLPAWAMQQQAQK